MKAAEPNGSMHIQHLLCQFCPHTRVDELLCYVYPRVYPRLEQYEVQLCTMIQVFLQQGTQRRTGKTPNEPPLVRGYPFQSAAGVCHDCCTVLKSAWEIVVVTLWKRDGLCHCVCLLCIVCVQV